MLMFRNAIGHFLNSWNLWYPLIMLAFFAICSFLLTFRKCSKWESDNKEQKTVFGRILDALYLGGVITLFCALIVTIFLLKFSTFFSNTPCQFGVMIGFFAIGTSTLIVYALICKRTKKKEMVLVNIPISKASMDERIKRLRKRSGRKVLLFLSLAIPFSLLWMPNKNSQLISIVLDNSVSMDAYLDFGIKSLNAVLTRSPHNGEYLLTTFVDKKSYWNDFEKISIEKTVQSIVETPADKLPAITEHCTNSIQLINTFSQINTFTERSPILQGIWQNYLTAKQLAGNKFKSKKMIIISDGEDILWVTQNASGNKYPHPDILVSKNGTDSPRDFFDGGIYGINLNADGATTNSIWGDCDDSLTEIFDGTDQYSYFEALKSVLPEMYLDWSLIYCLIILLTLFFLCIWSYYLAIK